MTAEEYFAIDAMNASSIVPGIDSMLQMKHYQDHGKAPTGTMNMGTYIHAAILEEHLFWERCAVWPRAKSGAPYQAFKAKHEGKWIVSTPEYDHIQGAVEAVYRNTDAKDLLRHAAKEMVIQWDDELCGPAKAKIDFADGCRWGCVKTCGNISERARIKTSYSLGYDIKLAWYRRGIKSKSGGDGLLCWIIWVEQNPPHAVYVKPVAKAFLDHGEKRIAGDSDDYKKWPGVLREWKVAVASNSYKEREDREPEHVLPGWVTGGEPVKLIDDNDGLEVEL